MATYSYQFVDEEGTTHVVERQFKMSERPDTIQVTIGDAVYTAHFILSLTAGKNASWGSWYTPSDLPDTDAPTLG